MSDLISRSELIKQFNTIQQQEDAIGLDFVAIIDEIKEQPTAYDIDKVVAEIIGEAHNTIVDFKLDKYVYTRKAIEIVKAGIKND